jgi:hypothetical protein
MRIVWMLLVLWPGAAFAWERLDDAGITAALSDRSLQYDQYTLQHFRKSGVTEYITERYSEGRWAARDGQYCSVWPPSDRWECYDVEAEGQSIRFIGSDGSIAQGSHLE